MEKEKIRNIIQFWWNDTMRKDWKEALADPDIRSKRFDELVVRIQEVNNNEMPSWMMEGKNEERNKRH